MLSDTVGFHLELADAIGGGVPRHAWKRCWKPTSSCTSADISHEDAQGAGARRRGRCCCASSASIRDAGGAAFLEVWNKIDRFSREERENLRNIAARRPPQRPCLLVSAVTGEGIAELLRAIEDRLAAKRMTLDLTIDAADGAGISWLHRNSEVLDKKLHDGRLRHDGGASTRPSATIVVSRFDAGAAIGVLLIANYFARPRENK